MATAYKNHLADGIGTGGSSVYTVPANTTAAAIGMTVANTTSASISVDVKVISASLQTAYLVKGASIDKGSTLVPIGGDQKIVLEAGDQIQVTSNTASSCDAILSVVEIS